MKKFLLLLFSICIIFCLSVTVLADEGTTVIYLETGGTGDGSFSDRPVGSLGKAVELLDKSKDCTIVICGPFTQTGAFTYPQEFTGSITITSVYDGIDYRDFGAYYDCVGARFVCTGEYIFKDINIILSGKYMFVIANHNPFTIDTGVVIDCRDSATDGLGFGTSFGILGGYQSGQPELRGVKDPPPAESNEDTNITVLSGENICISAYSRQIDGAYYTGTANVTVGGTAKVGRLFIAPANKPFTCGNAVVTVEGDATVSEIYASTSSGFADSLTLNWLGGSIGKYSDRYADGNDIIFSDGKTLCYNEQTKASSSFDAISKNFDKVMLEGTEEEAPKTVVEMTIGQDVAFINGSPVSLDAPPIIRNNRTMLPVRFLANTFGVDNDGIKWDAATRTATLKNSEVTIIVTIDAPSMTVNGENVALDAPAIIESNRTYLPVRAIANALGVSNENIQWDGATSTATLTKEGTFNSGEDKDIGIDTVTFHTIADLNKGEDVKDSHSKTVKNSSVELNFREYVEVDKSILATSSATYPRIKQMKNGEFIMFYQNAQIGSNIYYTTSKDTLSWEKAEVIFKLRSTTNFKGEQDSIRYSTCDAVVLENGDILAVASFRYNTGYGLDASQGGLALRRSTDNGKTWSDEKVIYVGINWEPFMTQHENGEVQIFFTHNAPKFYLDGKVDANYLSSGVGMLRSADNGNTWTPAVNSAPYSASIVMQQRRVVDSPVSLFTDQMPAVAHLNNGTSVMAVESRPDNGELYISLGYSSNNWSDTLGTEEVGPIKRADNIFEGAAPYILQFESGETLLSYNVNSRFSVRVGDANGENFGNSIIPFTKTGYWGTLEKRTSHSAIGSMANVVSGGNNAIMVGTMYLNHEISAPAAKIKLDGDNADWKDNTDALFIGSDSQAQVAIRTASSDSKIYFLFERADYSLTAADSITLYLADSTTDGFWRIRIGAYGVEEFTRSGTSIDKRDAKEIGYAALDIGTIANYTDTDIGKIIEISVPRSIFSDSTLRVNATLYNQDKNESKTSDTFSGATLSSTENWPLVTIK